MPTIDNIVLRTKLYKPKLTNDLVIRQDLIDRLEKNRHKPLTLVSASAGYGKSVLISQWLEQSNCSYAWISLDEEHNDLRIFISYLVISVQNIFPDGLSETRKLLSGVELPPTEVILRTLVNEMDIIEQEFIIVLDDFHYINDGRVNDFINGLLRFPPENVNIALLTRRDPPLDLIKLKSHDRINEFRVSHLRFKNEEIEILFKKIFGIDLNPETSKAIIQNTEGWITGIHLAVLSMSDEPDVTKLIEITKSGRAALVSEYLVQEVLSRQPGNIQKVLLKISILDRFCDDLIDIIQDLISPNAGKEFPGKELIQMLLKFDLFVIPLDDQGKWYRFHHFFKDLLQRELPEKFNSKEILSNHLLVSQWFANEGLIEESIKHALKSENVSDAVKTIVDNRYKLLNSEQFERFIRLLNMLPEGTVEQHPLLLTARGFYFEQRSMWAELVSSFEQLELHLHELDPNSSEYEIIQGEYKTLKAEFAYISGDKINCRNLSKYALDVLSDDAIFIKSFAMYWYAWSYQMEGQSKKGEKLFTDAIFTQEGFNIEAKSRLYIGLCAIYFIEGNLTKLKQTALKGLSVSLEHRLNESINMFYYFLACVHYWRNELDKAKEYSEKVNRNRYVARALFLNYAVFIQALVENALGNQDKAWHLIDSISAFANETDNNDSLAVIRACSIDLALMQKNDQLADELNHDIDFNQLPPVWLFHYRRLAEIKLIMAKESDGDNEKISKRFSELIDFGEQFNSSNFLIQVFALQALYYWKQKKEKHALESLTKSLHLAEAGAYIRIYLDLGSHMQDMLNRLLNKENGTDYIKKILAEFGKEKSGKRNDLLQSNRNTPASSAAGMSEVDIMNLTQRELEVLTILSQGFRNQEISDKLFVSLDTVKKHLYTAYQKLQVNSRVQAIAKARQMELIP